MDFNKIKIISAGAGSGKTYQLGEELSGLLEHYDISEVLATSFTKKAASELQERLAQKLVEKGKEEQSSRIEEAFIGTVNSVCGRILEKFSIEAGLKPDLKVLEENQAKEIFKLSLSSLWEKGDLDELTKIADKLSIDDIQQQILQVGKLIRSNNLSDTDIEDSKQLSISSYFDVLGETSCGDNWIETAGTLAESTLNNLNASGNDQKNTKTYQNLVNKFIAGIDNKTYTWKSIDGLTQKRPAARLVPLVQDFTDHLAGHHKSTLFQKDIQTLIEGVFDIASEAIEKYKDFKKDRGLIDFNDQEVLLNKLLEDDRILSMLGKEIKVLMVDEFQDTSPIQMKIFLRIAEVAEKVIFVGDPKQCIYEFRESDTYLINKLIEACGGIKKENILDTSYRSRKPLVGFANALFEKNFKDIPSEQVVLKANRVEDNFRSPALHLWKFKKEDNKVPVMDSYLSNLAYQVRELLESKKLKIEDSESNEMRHLRPGDIGILCNTNSRCQNLASHLKIQGVPASVENPGLLEAAEIRLIMAALKRIVFRQDTLSTAEILFLTDEKMSPSDLLEKRLRSINNTKGSWDKDSDVLKKLDALKPLLVESSPGLIVAEILNALDIYYIAGRWPNHHQRIANIQKFISYVVEYEERTRILNEPASIPGLLINMEKLKRSDNDNKGNISDAEAVQVLTYHRSKGLEWPIVFMLDLDREEKNYDGLFSVKMQVDEDKFDISNPLSHRTIRFWPWPYGTYSKGLAGGKEYKKLFDDNSIKKHEFEKYLEEEKRLMYVGITRARDYLVLPHLTDKQIWMRRVFGDSLTAKLFTPENSNSINFSGISWEGTAINYSHSIITVQELEECSNNELVEVDFYAPFKEKIESIATSKYISPSETEARDKERIALKAQVIHGRLPFAFKVEMDNVGNCIHNLLAAIDWKNQDHWDELISRFLRQYQLDKAIDHALLLAHIKVFIEFINSTYKPIRMYRELPIKIETDGQVFSGFIDLLLEVSDGFILIDYKTFPGVEDKLEDKTMEFTGQLLKYKEMVEKAIDKKVIESLIYYPVNGSITSVSLK